jgi:hypothetical protein
LPLGALSSLTGLGCAGPANCFAVGNVNGQALIEHWQGSKWVKVSSPHTTNTKSAYLRSVFCPSSHACWAVGGGATQQNTGPDRTLAEYWNGQHWSVVSTP